jgi:hypothetical protein
MTKGNSGGIARARAAFIAAGNWSGSENSNRQNPNPEVGFNRHHPSKVYYE